MSSKRCPNCQSVIPDGWLVCACGHAVAPVKPPPVVQQQKAHQPVQVIPPGTPTPFSGMMPIQPTMVWGCPRCGLQMLPTMRNRPDYVGQVVWGLLAIGTFIFGFIICAAWVGTLICFALLSRAGTHKEHIYACPGCGMEARI